MLLVLTFCLFNTSKAQQINRVFEDIGGGSGTTTNVNESKDNTFFYIAGAAIVAGIVVYAILRDKKPAENADTDTTSALNDEELINKHLSFNGKIQSYKTQIPVNLSIGIQNDKVNADEKRYFVGFLYNF
jgi:hypothetical protein